MEVAKSKINGAMNKLQHFLYWVFFPVNLVPNTRTLRLTQMRRSWGNDCSRDGMQRVDPFLLKTTTCIQLQGEQIFSGNIKYTYFFSILGVAFLVSLLSYFEKRQVLVVKKFEIIFAALFFCLYELKNCLRFFKSYFWLEILIFLSFVVSFLVDMLN